MALKINKMEMENEAIRQQQELDLQLLNKNFVRKFLVF